MQTEIKIRDLIDRINSMEGLLPQEKIRNEDSFDDIDDETNRLFSYLNTIDFKRVMSIRNALYNGLENSVKIQNSLELSRKSSNPLANAYFIIDDSKLSDYKRRNAVIKSLLDLIDDGYISHGDDIVMPYLLDKKNLWDKKRKGLGKTFEKEIRMQLLAKGFPEIYGYSNTALTIEVTKNLMQQNYLAAAVYTALFEDKCLIGNNSNPKEYTEGVLEYFVKRRNQDQNNFAAQNYFSQPIRTDGNLNKDCNELNVIKFSKKIAAIVQKPYILSDGIKDFCKIHDLNYAVLEIK